VTRFVLRLPQRQARVLDLAVAYHLSRPGSEIDPNTAAPYERGLREVLPVIDTQVDEPSAVCELTPLQVTLLGTALSSIVSELKMYSVFGAMSGASTRPRSVSPGFDERLRRLFPEVAADAAVTMELAEEAVVLRRQLPIARAREETAAEQEAASARRRGKGWRFWKR
jgi:hypothetical protein